MAQVPCFLLQNRLYASVYRHQHGVVKLGGLHVFCPFVVLFSVLARFLHIPLSFLRLL